MRCPACGANDTRVVDSRDTGEHVRRRRECQVCSDRFTTHERIERRRLWVMKSSGRKEPFDRDKVLAGIVHACRKRPYPLAELEHLADRVQHDLEDRRQQTVSSSVVGETVMSVLRAFDDVAYIRFASVYQAFESVDQFIEAVAPLQGEE